MRVMAGLTLLLAIGVCLTRTDWSGGGEHLMGVTFGTERPDTTLTAPATHQEVVDVLRSSQDEAERRSAIAAITSDPSAWSDAELVDVAELLSDSRESQVLFGPLILRTTLGDEMKAAWRASQHPRVLIAARVLDPDFSPNRAEAP